MPIFEPDSGRPRLVQPMQPLAGTFLGEVRTLLAEHLPAVVGEPLFPVRNRAALPDRPDVPEMLALDVTGRPVVIEVAQVVDDASIVDALRHAGAAARLTTADLARAYHPDPTRFEADYAAFREQVPFARPAELRYGTRLVLLCSEVASESVDALAAVRGPGWPVKVLQVGVVRGHDGRRLLDVSPLAAHEPARRPVEPTSLRLVHTGESAAAPTPEVSEPAAPQPFAAGPAQSPLIPTQPPLARSAAAAVAEPARAAASAALPAAPLATILAAAAPAYVSPPEAQPAAIVAPPSIVAPPAILSPPPAFGPSDLPASSPRSPLSPAGQPYTSQPYTSQPYARPAVAGAAQRALPELVALAAVVPTPAALVWERPRRGQRFEAALRADGLVELSSGEVFGDPDLAAAHAARAEGAVDGWRVWRLGEGGPTLAETVRR